MEWIQNNLLALYAAVVGTIALFLNFGRFWIMYQKSKRKLNVEAVIDERAQKQLDSLEEPNDGFGSRDSLCGPIYKVDVINTSHLQMHLQDAGLYIKTENGKEKLKVYVRGSHFLQHLNDGGGIDISPGSRESFSVYLKSDEPSIPKVIGCYVVDQLGKEYKGKFNNEGQQLREPTPYKEPNKSSKRDAVTGAPS